MADIRISQPKNRNPGFGRVPRLAPPAPDCRWGSNVHAENIYHVVACLAPHAAADNVFKPGLRTGPHEEP